MIEVNKNREMNLELDQNRGNIEQGGTESDEDSNWNFLLCDNKLNGSALLTLMNCFEDPPIVIKYNKITNPEKNEKNIYRYFDINSTSPFGTNL